MTHPGAPLSQALAAARGQSPVSRSIVRAPTLIAVGSTNPVKIQAVQTVVRQWRADAVVRGVPVDSGVPDQPWGDDETIRGAQQRAQAARDALGADLGVGIEGGVVEARKGELRTCAWAAVAAHDRSHVGGSLSMPLPPAVAELVRAGLELGHAMDQVSGTTESKQGAGAVGILTNGIVDRRHAYEVIVAYALAPLLAGEYWASGAASAIEAPR